MATNNYLIKTFIIVVHSQRCYNFIDMKWDKRLYYFKALEIGTERKWFQA